MPNEVTENKMGVMPVNKLLISMAVPIILSMLVQALYNIVDSMFVSQINENALTAVSLAFPAQNLMIAVAVGTGVGVNATLSRSLGAKNFERAGKIANNALFLAAMSYLAFAILGFFFSRTFFLAQTDIAEIVEYGADYLHVCTLFSFGLFGQIAFEKLLQSTGKTIYTMITQGIGAILNIIFDPILIFGMFGFPKMGVTGAALATVFGQTIGLLVGFLINHFKNHEVRLKLSSILHPDMEIIGHIYSIGVPSIIMGSIGSVMTFGMNKILIGFTSTATAVFGVYFKLQSFIFMPVFGLNNAMVPILAYNLGAGKPDRIMKTYKLAACYATGIMVLGFAIFQCLPGRLLQIFNASDSMLAIGVPALKTISFSFLLAGFSIVCSSLFQALGHGMLSLWVSLIRQLCVLLPAAWLLSKIGGLDATWYAYPIAELFSAALCAAFTRYSYLKEIKPLF
ncbi:MAG: MATE family efflux transporter [Lachnospiraceae bacterium]|nr:MATE family efflux transporter [Lachnospiraceae bacterium]